MSETNGVSDGAGFRQNLLFRHFWRTKNSIRRKPIGFGFSGLFDFLFLSCPNKFSAKWTSYFLCCSTTSNWLRFRLGTGLISDARRASAEVNGEKITELNDGWSLVFTKAGWLTRAASVFSEAKGKSYGLKMFLSQRKRPVARKPLAAISPFSARFYTLPNCSPIW